MVCRKIIELCCYASVDPCPRRCCRTCRAAGRGRYGVEAVFVDQRVSLTASTKPIGLSFVIAI
jgi:hypothetical protein